MDPYKSLLEAILPAALLSHFTLVKTEKIPDKESLDLFFEELNNPPGEHSDKALISNGFHKEITIQDFPLRGFSVFMHVKRRRWQDKDTGQGIQRDWNLVGQGTRMTAEFAAFLKEISSY